MSDSRDRRWLHLIAGVLTAAAVGLFVFTTGSSSELPKVTVYKSAACVCCGGWVEHMEDAGFAVGGMPAGSPGMPGPPEPYAAEAFTDAGATAVYAEH